MVIQIINLIIPTWITFILKDTQEWKDPGHPKFLHLHIEYGVFCRQLLKGSDLSIMGNFWEAFSSAAWRSPKFGLMYILKAKDTSHIFRIEEQIVLPNYTQQMRKERVPMNQFKQRTGEVPIKSNINMPECSPS